MVLLASEEDNSKAEKSGTGTRKTRKGKKGSVELLSTRRISELVQFILERGRKGISIQRYKGLGEMNAEQLWETTMNPEKRSLQKVTIEDVVEADEIFNTLMGDIVEPRREFIERNALNVRNLDV
jgi:DNA gyrase subunit B